MKAVQSAFKKAKKSKHPAGAVLIEPIQGRGGVVVPPPDFLKELRAFCDAEKVLLIADEVFTGFGRTGSMFASDRSGVVPDVMCLGKGMANGFPISACIGTLRVMYSWGASTGDSIHTSTFLGNPLGCAVALAVIKEMEDKKLADRSKAMGDLFRKELWKLKEKYPLIADVRGAGLMIGIELCEKSYSSKKAAPATEKARAFIAQSLAHGLVVLPSGPAHNVISLTPPFIITEKEIAYCIKQFDRILSKL
jgi:4-aminobutyrate aminotransferase-like enzyme